jgi:hypothetical protein
MPLAQLALKRSHAPGGREARGDLGLPRAVGEFQEPSGTARGPCPLAITLSTQPVTGGVILRSEAGCELTEMGQTVGSAVASW